MKIPRPLITLLGFLFISALIAAPASMHSELIIKTSAATASPVAVGDSFQVHGYTQLGNLMANDSDPDGDNIVFDSYGSLPQHGSFSGPSYAIPAYQPHHGYVGSDSFTYRICDSHGECSGYATVSLTITNAAPVATSESFTVHGYTQLGNLISNDYDPDGDNIFFESYGSMPQHGTFAGPSYHIPAYEPSYRYVGSDSFTYRICDSLGACSGYTTVNLTIVNNAPVAGGDSFSVHGRTQLSNLLANDADPDGDNFIFDSIQSQPQHGSLENPDLQFPAYNPSPGYVGGDSFTYRVCDSLGLCTNATVTLYVIGDGENSGAVPCESVGEPINVTNGNMYLQQTDYSLSSLGPAIEIGRTYNSNSQRIGLFGKGWSTAYDEATLTYDNNLVRLNEADGRATYFGRPVGSTGTLAPLTGDFHGQLSQGAGGTLTLSLKDGSVQQFNSAGKLISVADRNGNQTTLSYDTNGRLASITDPFGRTLTLTTNAGGQVLSISDTLGTIATYTYGAGDQLLSVAYADGSGFQFTYDGSNRLTAVMDALGNTVEAHTYDNQGRALTSERAGGVEHYTLTYVSSTQTDVTDALGHVTTYTFDTSKGRNVLTRVEGMCSCGGSGSQVQTWSYDSRLNVTSKTDALNHTVSFTYDGDGNQLTETDATGTVTFTYNQFGQVLTRTDQLNGVTTNTFDASGNLLTTKDALNNTTTFTYDARGQLLTSTDARGKVTTFTYDATGNQTQRRNANSITTYFFFDARSRLTKVRDALSRSTLYAYDAMGRIIKQTHPDNSFVSFTYDLAGRRTKVTDERGNATNYAYDGAYRLTSLTDAANQTTTYTYDAMSNLTSVTDALGRVTNYDYDDFNRLAKITYPPASAGATRLFATMNYDAAGNVAHRTDTAGRVTTYLYDNVNRVTSITDADNKTTGVEYDALGRVTGVLDALNQHYQFTYDAVGRQTHVTRGGVSMSFVYDEVGNRTQRTDYNGTVTNYTYNNLNSLIAITYPTRTLSYGYNVLGQLTRAADEHGAVYIGYDNRSRVSTYSDPFYYGVSYNYDAVGNRTKLSLNGATYATYAYDAVNRLTNLKDSANQDFTHSYDAVNRLTGRTAPNGVTSSYGYDGLNRLTSLAHTKGTNTLSGNQYQYSDASTITNWANATGNHAYNYDSLSRLASVTNTAQPNESYSYDAVGNRTSSHLSATYGYQPFNKLTSTAAASYVYDSNGNLISETNASGTKTFIWNEENQLIQVLLPSGLSVNYKYDALGRRIERATSAGASERYVYDGADVLLDLNADWSVATTYLNGLGIDNHLRQTSATTGVAYYLTDHLGSTAGLTDATGNVVEQIAYDSYGNSTGSTRTRYGYTGRERDPDTTQLYYRARFYDPPSGRFTGEDPMGLLAGLNLYAYVDNQPTGAIDPTGLQRLAPLGRNGQERRVVNRAELERLMTPRGANGLPDEVKRKLDDGCVGMCSVYQGFNAIFPENAPGTNCYLEESLARSRKCPRCCRNFVFAKQGHWWRGIEPRPDPMTKRIPNGSIDEPEGHFNYIVYFPSTRSYAWMNNRVQDGNQLAEISSSPLQSTVYPNTMWCSTCKPISGRR